MRRYRWLIGVVVLVGAAFGIRMLFTSFNKGPRIFRPELAKEFFDRYVDGDGRVVRRDQGSDSVSEGQAYAMLLAVALDDASSFDLVWQWARRELQRPDGLLSWHWAGGRVTDREPATDADVDAAYALLLAGDRFGQTGYLREARRIADAILDRETIRVGDEHVLVAGPWARDERVINPSYFTPEPFRRFASAFDDGRWQELHDDSLKLIRRLTSDGQRPPPDWARMDSDGSVERLSRPPGSGAMPSSGLDAGRVPIRFAASCSGDDREFSASLWPSVRGLASANRHPLEIVAAAAAAGAAGETDRRDALLVDAEHRARANASYYGWAWVALGRAMLDAKALYPCGGLGLAAEFAPHPGRRPRS